MVIQRYKPTASTETLLFRSILLATASNEGSMTTASNPIAKVIDTRKGTEQGNRGGVLR
jgi:hypothetical protein